MNKKTQSIIEYIITIAAVVGFIIAATAGLRRGVEAGLDNAQVSIEQDLGQINYVGQVIGFGPEGNPLTPIEE